MQGDTPILIPRKTLLSFDKPSKKDMDFANQLKRNIMQQTLTNFIKNKNAILPSISTKSIKNSKIRKNQQTNIKPQQQHILTSQSYMLNSWNPEIKKSTHKFFKSSSTTFQKSYSPKKIQNKKLSMKVQEDDLQIFRITQNFSKQLSERDKKKKQGNSLKMGFKFNRRSKSFKESINIKKYRNLI